MNRSKLAVALLLGTALSALALPVLADDGFTAGSILVHARVIGVIPTTGNNGPTLNGPGTPLATALGASGGNSGQVFADSVVVPEVDASYFFTPNLAVEVIAATTRNGLQLNNISVGASHAPANLDIGNTWILPPTVTAQWHFLPTSRFNPYVGAGINYTFFYNTVGGSVDNQLRLKNNFGEALQFGANYNLTGHWYANFDAKKIFLQTTAKAVLSGIAPGAQLEVKDVRIDPWIIGAGIGYRF